MATDSNWLTGSDFSETAFSKRQTNVLLFGDGGTGKTTFATMYAPQPVAYINLDKRGYDAVTKAREAGRRIPYFHASLPSNVTQLDDGRAKQAGQTVLDAALRNIEWAVRQSQKGNIKSICIDTGTEFSEAMKIAMTGRLDKVKGDYGKSKDLINQQWWRVFNMAREGYAHLIVLSRAKAIWLNNEPTGNFTYRGPEVMYDAVDWCGHIRLKRGVKGKPKKEFELEIAKAGVTISELGAVYSEADWEELGGPFVYACMMQYPGTTPDEWM